MVAEEDDDGNRASEKHEAVNKVAEQVTGKKENSFDPLTEDAKSQKYPGQTWAQLPSGYLTWTEKNSKNPTLKKKASATLKYLKMQESQEPQQESVVDEMFPPTEPEAGDVFDNLCASLNAVAHTTLDALTHWLKDAEPKMKNLKAPEKVVLHKAWKNAVDDLKKAQVVK
jgi:hypothetical protein